MLPPGRRRSPALSLPSCLLLFVFLFTTSANAAGSVLGIDFGTQYFKAALVKPGIPNEIVLTKDSKRKETAAVAFKLNRDITPELGSFPERQYGSDALALQGRMPGEVFPNLKPLLGITWNDYSPKVAGQQIEHGRETFGTFSERYPALRAGLDREKGTTVFKSSAFVDEEEGWSVEELLAMELANIRRNAESMAGKGNTVEDAVITVPAFYTADERRAITTAATLAGLNVDALISDGLAVGIDYAKSRTFPEITKGEQPEHHLVFDMGAGSTTATLLRFQSRSVKDVGRFNKTVQEVAVLGTGWDRTLGGDSLTTLIVDDYIQKFLTKEGVDSKVAALRTNGRAMSRLWREAESARQMLSANTEKSSSFEELLPDTDAKVKITRMEFETLAASFADRVAEPIKAALDAAKLKMKDVDSIILHGGAVRTPFVQKKLEEIAGDAAKLRSNVNADESAVFGAAFKGAGLSPSFKVKDIRSSDVAGYAAGMVYLDGESWWGEKERKPRRQNLFTALSPVGHGATTKQVPFKDVEDFSFSLFQLVDGQERSVSKIETSNLTASIRHLRQQHGCEWDQISTKFAIRLSPANGVPEVVSGAVSCEVVPPVKLGDTARKWFGIRKKDDEQEIISEDEGSGEEAEPSATSSGSSASATESKAPAEPKKSTESVAIAFTTTLQGNPQPAPEELKRMRNRLSAFDRSDRGRFAREEALNVLEGYTYHVRDLLDNADISAVSTSAQRGDVSKLLASTREFLESAGKATKESLGEKLEALQALVEPIKSRRAEAQARPEKVEKLRESLDQTQKLVEMVAVQVQQAEDSKRKAEEYDASVSADAAAKATEAADVDAANEASSSSGDDLADLEEPDSAPKVEDENLPPKYHNAADFTPYTNVDLTELQDLRSSVLAWLEEKEAAQAKLSPHEEPVLLVSEIEKKAEQLGTIMKDLLYKKMKKAPTSSGKQSKAKASKTKSAKKGKKTGEDKDEAVKGKFMTVNSDDEMPTEDEILEMVSSARASATSSSSIRDEL